MPQTSQSLITRVKKTLYVFSEYNTSRQVRVVFPTKEIVKDLDFYNISGKGYKLDAFDYLIEDVEAVKYAR